MKIKFLFRLLLILISTSIAGVAVVVASNDKELKQQELRSLQAKIAKLKQVIDVKEDSKSRYTGELRNIEKNIGRINRKIRDTGSKIARQQDELKDLRAARKTQQQRLSRENDALAQQVYAAFTMGKQERVKLFFSQQDSSTFQRNLVYYQYFSNARVNLITTVQQNIDSLIETELQIRQTTRTLETAQEELRTQIALLDQDRHKRQKIIANLEQQLKKQGRFLGKLEDDAGELQNLIASIQDILSGIPEPDTDRQSFGTLRGQLAWPVTGEVKNVFGRQKTLTNLKWQGIMINAPAGEYVKAISHGRVAFADWLRGMGNLIIIDHGNSYLSLYGHNESLYKTAGEWVESGDIISSIGSSGGQQESGLYFEIRSKGKPLNPTQWCKAGNRYNS